jgi:DNA-binding MarR family transcriptional regulator
MTDTPDSQDRFPTVGDRDDRHNTASMMGEAFFKLGGLIAAGVAEAGYPQRPIHSTVFAHIDAEHGSRLTELAERSSVTPQSMSDVVNELVRMGYVQRIPDPSDRRAKRIVLTEFGQGGIRTGFEVIADLERQLEALLGAEDLRLLRDVLRRIVAAPMHPRPDAKH